MSDRDEPWRSRVQAEQATIQSIAEYLQRDRPDKTISELWTGALAIFRTRSETGVGPPEDERAE